MTGLREHFADLADQAKLYDVTERVVRRTRRRRRLERLAPVAVAAAVLVGTVAWVSAARSPAPRFAIPPPVPVVDATGPAQRGTLDGLPATWDVPAQPPVLPTDRGVGPAALAWCDKDGTEYGVLLRDGSAVRVPAEVTSLSPDGRWLAYGPRDRMRLRDLTGTTDLALGAVSVVGWTPDGRHVGLAPPGPYGARPQSVDVLEPATGLRKTVAVPDPEVWEPIGLLDSGEVVFVAMRDRPADPGTTPTADPGLAHPTLSPQPATTTPAALPGSPWPVGPDGVPAGLYLGAATPDGAWRHLGVPAVPGTGEFVAGAAMLLAAGPDPGSFVVQTYRTVLVDGHPWYLHGDLVVVAADSGGPRRLIRLPDAGRDDWRSLVSAGPDGILLTARSGGRTEVLLVDPDTGRRTVVSEVPPEVAVLLPGAGEYA